MSSFLQLMVHFLESGPRSYLTVLLLRDSQTPPQATVRNALHFVVLLSGSIKTVANKDRYIPSRRTGKVPLGAKVFSYYTQNERRLVERAAKLEHRSLSSFVAIAAVERAQRVLDRK
jgi:hypothetical protein